MATVAELIKKLEELPPDWRAVATKAGGSIEVWDPKGVQYGYVFTDDRPARMLVDRRREQEEARR